MFSCKKWKKKLVCCFLSEQFLRFSLLLFRCLVSHYCISHSSWWRSVGSNGNPLESLRIISCRIQYVWRYSNRTRWSRGYDKAQNDDEKKKKKSAKSLNENVETFVLMTSRKKTEINYLFFWVTLFTDWYWLIRSVESSDWLHFHLIILNGNRILAQSRNIGYERGLQGRAYRSNGRKLHRGLNYRLEATRFTFDSKYQLTDSSIICTFAAVTFAERSSSISRDPGGSESIFEWKTSRSNWSTI